MDFKMHQTRNRICSAQSVQTDPQAYNGRLALIIKNVARYLNSTKKLCISMIGGIIYFDMLHVVGHSDAEFAVDKGGRKSVTGIFITIDDFQ